MLKYKIGDKVSARIKLGWGCSAIDDASEQDPIFIFEVVGIRKLHFQFFDYILLILDDELLNTGWKFTPDCWIPGKTGDLISDFDGLPRSLLDKRGIGCYEYHLSLTTNSIAYGASCINCNLFNDYVPVSSNYICYNCRS